MRSFKTIFKRKGDIVCLRKHNRLGVVYCPALRICIGRTNMNQNTDKECYTCNLGQFILTRDRNTLPSLCRCRRMALRIYKDILEALRVTI